jgi:hypothetical protein
VLHPARNGLHCPDGTERGVAILTGDSSSNLPSPARLEAVALHLAGRGDHRALITLVETWAELAIPTVPVRLAEARSFVSLRMVDRAWVRLKDLVECAEPNVEALQIAAQMFLLRGWQNQARKVVQVGLERVPGDPMLEALAIQATESPPTIDDVTDDNAMSAELVRVAEQHMARGAFVRARTLLERVRRRDPGHQRTGELLWAIRGEFASTETLASMCERWAPPMPTGPTPDEDGFEEPEHTVTARVEDLRPAAEDRSFPMLFRNLEGPPVDGETTEEEEELPTPEVTAIRSLAESGELDVSFSDLTDHGEDTQIARVMRKGGILQPIDTPLHAKRLSSEDASWSGGFNLADFRREMGVPDLASDLQGPEDEDDSLVIRTGAEAEPDTSETGHDLSLDTRDERLAKARQGSAEESWAAPSTEAPRPRILGRPAQRARSLGMTAREASEQAEADEEPTTRLPSPPTAPRRSDPAADAPTTALDGRSQRGGEEGRPGRGSAERSDPSPEPEGRQGAPPLSEPHGSGAPTEEVEPEYLDQPDGAYDPWHRPPPPIAWPYWFFGLTAVLAIFMMLFFLVAVASALL